MADIQLNYDVAVNEVSSFKNFGKFNNNLDSFVNYQLVFSVAQSVNGNVNYVKIPLKTFVYNEEKITDANVVDFTELQVVQLEEKRNVDEVLSQYNNLL